MSKIVLSIPDESLFALKITAEEAGATLRLVAAMKLFEMGRLSSGAASHLSGVPRVVFLSRLADYHIDTFQLTEDQLLEEIRFA